MAITRFILASQSRHIVLTALFALVSFSATASERLRIYAASSMTNAVNELITQYKQQHEVEMTAVYGGTSSLARQIEHGAPADILIAANQKWVDFLINSDVISSDAVTNIATNQLVVISKNALKPFDIKQSSAWLEALQGQRLAIGQPDAVPAGIYAKQSLEHLGVWPKLNGYLAPTNNVRVALTLVERGETPLGIVYQTDALQSDQIRTVVRLPQSSHSTIVYPMVKLTNNNATTQFVHFVQSDAGQTILSRFGFSVATELK